MTHKNSGDLLIIHTKIHTPQNIHFSEKKPGSKMIQIQNIDAQIMAKPRCTYKYQSTPKTCVYMYWWRSSVKVLGQDNSLFV